MTNRFNRAYRGYVIYYDEQGKYRIVYSNQQNINHNDPNNNRGDNSSDSDDGGIVNSDGGRD